MTACKHCTGVCSCLFGARNRKTGERHGVTAKTRGELVHAHAMQRPNEAMGRAETFSDQWRFVRIRKVRKPKPSERLAAWQSKSIWRLISMWFENNTWNARAYGEGVRETQHGPTPAAAMRALVAAMGKAVPL